LCCADPLHRCQRRRVALNSLHCRELTHLLAVLNGRREVLHLEPAAVVLPCKGGRGE